MAKRRAVKPEHNQEAPSIEAMLPDQGQGPATVLLFTSSGPLLEAISLAFDEQEVNLVAADSFAEAGELATEQQVDLALVDCRLLDEVSQTVVQNLASAGNCAVVLLSDAPSLEQALLAFQLSAVDYLVGPFAGEEFSPANLRERLRRCLERSLSGQQQEDRVRKLKRVCKKLNTARREVTQQLDSLCNDMVTAYHGLAEQMTQMTLASEFQAMVRQELDIESCLRSVLEFVLNLSGPTNAAVFLPSNHLDFSLGAYVNYDLPRDSLDVLLDHLADVIPSRVQDEEHVLEHANNDDLRAWLGDDAAWVEDSQLITISCRHDDECLAVMVLFRDQTHPFVEELASKMGTIAPIFAKQLAQIIRVHNRVAEDQEWHGFDYEDDSGDLAA
jgi:DNA-binding response OmpR family regulator